MCALSISLGLYPNKPLVPGLFRPASPTRSCSRSLAPPAMLCSHHPEARVFKPPPSLGSTPGFCSWCSTFSAGSSKGVLPVKVFNMVACLKMPLFCPRSGLQTV